MGFAPLEELEGPITLTIRGKQYALPIVTASQGASLHKRIVDGITEGELGVSLLGDVLAVMIQDGVSLDAIQRVTAVALADWRLGRDAAEAAWTDPKGFAAMVSELTTKAREVTETSTQQQGSGSSTTLRKQPQDRQSRGKKSSRSTSA